MTEFDAMCCNALQPACFGGRKNTVHNGARTYEVPPTGGDSIRLITERW